MNRMMDTLDALERSAGPLFAGLALVLVVGAVFALWLDARTRRRALEPSGF